MKKQVYIDYNATTPVYPEVSRQMGLFNTRYFANPSSIHQKGCQAAGYLKDAINQIAQILNVEPTDIICTSGGTESNNLALKGTYWNSKYRYPHIISSSVEHKSVLGCLKFLQTIGCRVTYLSVDSNGIINPDDVKNAIRRNTILISVMHANNETGVLQPIKEIAKTARENNVLFHTDAVQTFSKTDINIWDLKIDMLSASAHKFYGPKGAGLLYKAKGIKLTPLMHGSLPSNIPRAGTKDTAGIVGMAQAAKHTFDQRKEYWENMQTLTLKLYSMLKDNIKGMRLNGHLKKRMPNTLNISFEGINAQVLLAYLDQHGVYASAGAACTSDEVAGSHVLKAMGLDKKWLSGAVRFSLGWGMTEEDIDYVGDVVIKVVQKLQK